MITAFIQLSLIHSDTRTNVLIHICVESKPSGAISRRGQGQGRRHHGIVVVDGQEGGGADGSGGCRGTVGDFHGLTTRLQAQEAEVPLGRDDRDEDYDEPLRIGHELRGRQGNPCPEVTHVRLKARSPRF